MNILLVSSYLPYPLFSGGHIRLYNLIKHLSRKHEVTLACEKRDYQGVKDIAEVQKFCQKVITVPRKKQWTLQNMIKTGFSPFPFLITGHINSQMEDAIKRELNQNQFDLVHVETFYVMQNIPDIHPPLVLVEHNIEYLVYQRFVDTAASLVKPLLYLDILKLRYWEERAWKKATKLVAVSRIEKEIMEKVRKDVVVVSNGVDIAKFKVQSSKFKAGGREKRILFIGEFKWVENRNAIEWILKEIWPKLKAEFIPQIGEGGLTLWVVGRHIPDSIKKLTNDKSVIFDENAPRETELIYQKSDVLLAPIRVGGGTSFKVLEAMASGVPVVTTPLGNSIEAKENLEILIAKDSKDFAGKIKRVLEDAKLHEKISIHARKLVEEKFNWEKITQDLESVYESVAPYA